MIALVGLGAAGYPMFHGPTPRKIFVGSIAFGAFLVWVGAGLVFVAGVGDGYTVNQVTPQDGDLLDRRIVLAGWTSVIGDLAG